MKIALNSTAFAVLLLLAVFARGQDFEQAVEASRSGDHETAYQIWSVLAEGGHPDSQFNLAMMYVHGDGVERDLVQAAKWFQKAAEQGHVMAQARLGALYANGMGVDQDFDQAADWLYQAAEADEASSQYDLAVLYANGTGVEQDYSAAYYWFTRSAINGFVPAQEAQAKLREMLPPQQIGMVEQIIQKDLGIEVPAQE